MSALFSLRDAAVLARCALKKKECECEECGDSCHPDNSTRDYSQWLQNQLCLQCNENGFEEEQSDLRSIV